MEFATLSFPYELSSLLRIYTHVPCVHKHRSNEGDRGEEGGGEGDRSVDLASFRKILGVVGKIAGRSTGWNIVNNYLVRQVVMRMLIRRRYVRRVARMIVGVRSGMVLMLGLRRERLGRRGRCPRPVVRPVAFIGAIHLQGRISSTRPEESLPPSTHGDTKDSDTDMATLIPGRIRDTLDSDSLLATCWCPLGSPSFEMLRYSLDPTSPCDVTPFFSSLFPLPFDSSSFQPKVEKKQGGKESGRVLSDIYLKLRFDFLSKAVSQRNDDGFRERELRRCCVRMRDTANEAHDEGVILLLSSIIIILPV